VASHTTGATSGAAVVVTTARFTPVEAVDAEEAVAILESRSDIALLFTDVQIPGIMDGLRTRCMSAGCRPRSS
jgi:CheY-like chemotaxis protein